LKNPNGLSGMLRRIGVPHNVLNAKYHEQEAQIIAQAGRAAAVTIATNMAGAAPTSFWAATRPTRPRPKSSKRIGLFGLGISIF
jgi:hypothetical protein